MLKRKIYIRFIEIAKIIAVIDCHFKVNSFIYLKTILSQYLNHTITKWIWFQYVAELDAFVWLHAYLSVVDSTNQETRQYPLPEICNTLQHVSLFKQ